MEVQVGTRNSGGAHTNWHTLSAAEVSERLGTSSHGLSSEEAAKRLALDGPNRMPEGRSKGALELLWQQLCNPIVGVLVASAIIAYFADPEHGAKNSIVVLAVVVINTLVGFIQEFRAERAIRAIAGLIPEIVHVIRDGVKIALPAAHLTRGDIVHLASGDKVPADLRLLAAKNLKIQEAALTGESVSTDKSIAPLEGDLPLGDRTNLAYAGTLVTSGNGSGVVVEISSNTELGKISTMLENTTSLETPLTVALARIGGIVTRAVVILSLIILAVGTIRTELVSQQGWLLSLLDTLTFAVALAVAAIPEGLPAVVTIALAIGVRRMADRKAVVKRLPAVETLGSTTVICSDKTGTLTRNEMTVCELWTPTHGEYLVSGVGYEPIGEFSQGGRSVSPNEAIRELLSAASLCNEARLTCEHRRWGITGDPTEGAIIVAAEKAGITVEALRAAHVRLDAIPFESQHQYMAILLSSESVGKIVYLKGAPEVVLARCAPEIRDTTLKQAAAMASSGMRVLAVASKKVGSEVFTLTEGDLEGDLSLLGLLAMIDPPRPEALEAIKSCHEAGITVKMITGDHPSTAQAIGEQLGLCAHRESASSHPLALSGSEISKMSDAELAEASARYNVFARVAPEHKLRLVRALQSQSHVVAMTGDGVNDSPALKQADIGIAMGITGTSASKEAASIVLSDDNFATIAAAVQEGRRVYDNLIKSLAFIMPTNLGLALIFMIAVALFPFDIATKDLLLPMNPAQLLWINLVATVALALPLAFEEREPNIMKRSPRILNTPIFSPTLILRTFTVAVAIALASIAGFLFEYSQHEVSAAALAKAQTLAVTVVIFCQIVYVLQCRTLDGTLSTRLLRGNPYVFAGIAALLLLQGFFIYTPPFQALFDTAPLSALELLTGIVLSLCVLAARYVEGGVALLTRRAEPSPRTTAPMASRGAT